MNEIKLHDIKDLSEIPDISIYLFFILLVVGVAFLSLILFLIYKYFFNKKKNERKKYYKILEELDLTKSKQSAYTISKYARLLVSNTREEKLCEELIEILESYKYKKDVSEISDDVKIVFGRFMDNIDV